MVGRTLRHLFKMNLIDRSQDRSRQIGWALSLAAASTILLAAQAAALDQRWAQPLKGLGISVLIVGCYLVSRRDLLVQIGHRTLLMIDLAGVAVCALETAWRFHPGGVDLPSMLMKGAMNAAAFFTASAAGIGMVALGFGRRPATSDERHWFTLAATRSLGIATLLFSLVYVLIAAMFSVSGPMRATALLTAASLCLAARESFHDAEHYPRLLASWVI